MKRGLIFLLLFQPTFLFAEENNYWSEGLHVFAGVGANFASYRSDDLSSNFGLGSNLKADVVWVFDSRWALESSSSVKFNRVDSILVWDTMLTLGARYRFTLPFVGNENAYARAFYGNSATVAYLRNRQLQKENGNATRLHFEGTSFGFGIGGLYETESRNIWFLEANFSRQDLKERESVAMEGEASFAISSVPVRDKSRIYTVVATVGLLLF